MDEVESDQSELDLTAEMRRRIEQHTNEKLDGLSVRQTGGKVVLSGHASSYYFLQLALATARDLAGRATLEIHVEISAPETASAGQFTNLAQLERGRSP